jgi:hypothetical protein
MIYNFDSVFFEIEYSSDQNLNSIINAKDIISLTINEEIGQMDSASIVFDDSQHLYSHLLRPGFMMQINWGIKAAWGERVERRGMEFMINSPAGEGSDNGQIHYSCNLLAQGFRGEHQNEVYTGMMKGNLVWTVFNSLGIIHGEVNFIGMNQQLTGTTQEVQNESDFRFLVRKANEWGCAFHAGYDGKGNKAAIFVDYARLPQAVAAMGLRDSLFLDYGGWQGLDDIDSFSAAAIQRYKKDGSGGPNVISYSWQDNSMNNANGQAAFMAIGPDGNPMVMRRVVKDQQVLVYRLVPERIQEAYNREVDEQGIASASRLMGSFLLTTEFEQIKWAFDVVPESTAPQGTGIEVSAHLMGDPQITCGCQCGFGIGFPNRVGSTGSTWWVRKATHTISQAGYFVDIQAVDAFAFSADGTQQMPPFVADIIR